MQDKIRFSRGLEQASLFVTAENNDFRAHKIHYGVTSQNTNISPEMKKAFEKNLLNYEVAYRPDISSPESYNLALQQYLRNIDMIKSITRTYYIPMQYGNTYKDRYAYSCGLNARKNVLCKMDGDFDRKSWMYFGSKFQNHVGSFDEYVKIGADKVFITKQKQNASFPVDFTLIIDMSNSMNKPLYDIRTNKEGEVKINMLRRSIDTLTKDFLKPEYDKNQKEILNYRRMRYVMFSFGAQDKSQNKVIFPFKVSQDAMTLREFREYTFSNDRLNHKTPLKSHRPFKSSLKAEFEKVYSYSKSQSNTRPSGDPMRAYYDQISTYSNCFDYYQYGVPQSNGKRGKKWVKTPYCQRHMGEQYWKQFWEEKPAKERFQRSVYIYDEMVELTKRFSTPGWHKGTNVPRLFDVKATVDSIMKYDGSPLESGQDIIGMEKGCMAFYASSAYKEDEFTAECSRNKYPNQEDVDSTSQKWFNHHERHDMLQSIKRIKPTGSTIAGSGLLVGANLSIDKSHTADLHQRTEKKITKMIAVLSDGMDTSLNLYYDRPSITPDLIKAGACERIREKLKEDPNVDDVIITFIKFGHDKLQAGVNKFGQLSNPELKKDEERFDAAWEMCVDGANGEYKTGGKSNFIYVGNETELIEALQISAGVPEEIGHITTDKNDQK